LVRCYHGLGDTIQFARFLPRLERLASQVSVWLQPELMSLFETLPMRPVLLPLHDGTPEVDYDVDIEIMELPHALRISSSSLPAKVPYFGVPAAPRFSTQYCVGLVAKAGGWDRSRSIPADALIGAASGLDGVALFNLQLGEHLPGLVDVSSTDSLVLASRLQALDLVITVDTMVAHLAGALGVRTWTILPAEADWRWMLDRDDSPWYPTMRLYRQREPGDWGSALAAVHEDLRFSLSSSGTRQRIDGSPSPPRGRGSCPSPLDTTSPRLGERETLLSPFERDGEGVPLSPLGRGQG
jgi:hypothetical protein